MSLLKTEVQGFLKDTRSGAIINNNTQEYDRILAARQQAKTTNQLCKRMDIIEAELKTIKHLLADVLNGINK